MNGILAASGGRRVGDLAWATGLTVRTLHYYEEIGLLVPSGRSPAGHRLYAPSDVERLYRICLLRRLGLPLASIADALDAPAWSVRSVMAAHLSEVDRTLDGMARLRARLVRLLSSLDRPGRPAADGIIQLIEEMTAMEAVVQRRISILVYTDLEAAYDHLIRVFGLGPGQLARDGAGHVRHAELEVGDGVVWLHPESPAYGLRSPRSTGAATGSMAVLVGDVDAHFRHSAAEGADIVYEPLDQPYGYREYSARDSEGGLWSFMTPIA